jgi:hypothetical protein
VPIVSLGRESGLARLQGRPAGLGSFFIETAAGSRVVELHAERGHAVTVALPAGQPLFVRGGRGEAELTVAAGETRDFSSLSFRTPASGARGAIESSFERGLFATAFGPHYYRGFVDQSDDMVPVALPAADLDKDVELGLSTDGMGAGSDARPARVARWLSFAPAAAFGVAAGVFGVNALDARSDYASTKLEQDSRDASARYERNTARAAYSLAGAVVSAAVGYVVLRLLEDN